LDGKERLTGGLVYRALVGTLKVENKAAMRADELVICLRSMGDQPLADKRFAGGFTGYQGAEQPGEMGVASCFGLLDVRHEALTELQLIKAGRNQLFDRYGHAVLLFLISVNTTTNSGISFYPEIEGEAVFGCDAAKPHHTQKQQSSNFRIGLDSMLLGLTQLVEGNFPLNCVTSNYITIEL